MDAQYNQHVRTRLPPHRRSRLPPTSDDPGVSVILAVLSFPTFADVITSLFLQWCAQAGRPWPLVISTPSTMGLTTLRPHHVACSPTWAIIRLPMSQRTSTAHSFKHSSVSCCPLPPFLLVTAFVEEESERVLGICFKKHFGRSSSHRD